MKCFDIKEFRNLRMYSVAEKILPYRTERQEAVRKNPFRPVFPNPCSLPRNPAGEDPVRNQRVERHLHDRKRNACLLGEVAGGRKLLSAFEFSGFNVP